MRKKKIRKTLTCLLVTQLDGSKTVAKFKVNNARVRIENTSAIIRILFTLMCFNVVKEDEGNNATGKYV